eukprot:m.190587 g.190587  ORF g.190587 m.190587 type:complete len:440 (+) comp39435_c0_seq3:26-1345(+)
MASSTEEEDEKAAFEIDEDEEKKHMCDVDDSQKEENAKKVKKNVIILSFSFLAIFTAYFTLQNLQSSLNTQKSLGTICLASLYGALCFGSLILAPLMVGTLRPKRTLLVTFISHLAFTASNYYPRFFTLIPTCVLLGAMSGPLWAAQNTYLTTCSVRVARLTGSTKEVVIQQLTGIFFMIFQSSQILGNLISSLVFHFGGSAANATTVNASMVNATGRDCSYCNANDTLSAVPDLVRYALMGIFSGCQLVGMLLLAFGVASLKKLGIQSGVSHNSAFHLVVSVFKLHLQDYRMVLLIAISIYSGLEQEYIYGEYTKYFVTDCIGIKMVGYVMILFGVVNALVSFLSGKLAKFTGMMPIILSGAALNMCLILVLRLWHRSPNEATIFAIAALWGIVDAIFNTQTVALFGTLFTDKQEAAFGSYRFWQSVGFLFRLRTATL